MSGKKIANTTVILMSDARLPTRAAGGHGLGRLAHTTARLLVERAGTQVIAYGAAGSEFPDGVEFRSYDNEFRLAEQIGLDLGARIRRGEKVAAIDMTHEHALGKLASDLPVLHWIVDTECAYQPPNAVVCNAAQLAKHPHAKILEPAVFGEYIPFYRVPENPPYLAYAAKIHINKGFDIALDVHERQSVPVRFVGAGGPIVNYDGEQAAVEWREELTGKSFYQFIGHAIALLSPSRLDAGGIVNIEAAFASVPVLALEDGGADAYVAHGLSGYICRDVDEMVARIPDAVALRRKTIRVYARDRFSTTGMYHRLLDLLESLLSGVRW